MATDPAATPPAGNQPGGNQAPSGAPAGAPAGDPPPTHSRPSGPPRRGRGRGRYTPRRKVCQFCVDKVDAIDYKDVTRLRRFISEHGKIEPRRKTGTCAKHQRRLAHALKRARHIALLPFTAQHILGQGQGGWYQPPPFFPPAQHPAPATPAAHPSAPGAAAPQAPAGNPAPSEAPAPPAEAPATPATEAQPAPEGNATPAAPAEEQPK